MAANLGEFIQEHPIVLAAGAVAVGLAFFTSSNRGQQAAQTTLQPKDVTPTNPPDYITATQFDQWAQQFDDLILQQLAQYQQQGQPPPPNPPSPPPPRLPIQGPPHGPCGPGFVECPNQPGTCVQDISLCK